MDRFFEQEDWFLPIFSRWEIDRPAMDVYETDKDVIAEINVPGFDPEKIEVSIENNMLKVKGDMEEKKEEKNKGYWRKEIRKGSFERAVSLPTAVKEDQAEATYEKGVLKVVMPKAQIKPASKAKIKVRSK